MTERNMKRKAVGVVTSNKMDKTITVNVPRTVQHPIFRKYIKKFTTLKAHDEKNTAHIGDKVELMETRKLSKTKSWRLVRVLEKSKQD